MTLDRISTERLVLRPWAEADAEAALAIYSDDSVWPWLGADPAPCPDLEAALARVRRWATLGDTPLGSGPLGFWAIEAPGIGEISPDPCGSVILLALPRSDGAPSTAVEIGWHLHPAAWGRGIATEAALALLERARAAGLEQVHAVVRPDNVRSVAVCERLGMTNLGRTTEWYGTEFVDFVLAL